MHASLTLLAVVVTLRTQHDYNPCRRFPSQLEIDIAWPGRVLSQHLEHHTRIRLPLLHHHPGGIGEPSRAQPRLALVAGLSRLSGRPRRRDGLRQWPGSDRRRRTPRRRRQYADPVEAGVRQHPPGACLSRRNAGRRRQDHRLPHRLGPLRRVQGGPRRGVPRSHPRQLDGALVAAAHPGAP